MTLGEQIKQAREMQNLSQEELAEHMGVTRQSVSKWENNTSVPQGVNREILAKVLNLNLAEKEETENAENEKTIRKLRIAVWLGWIFVALLLLFITGVSLFLIRDDATEESGQSVESMVGAEQESVKAPEIKSIQFLDSDQNMVSDEGLWYNSAGIESILIQWDGGTVAPDNVKMLYVPSGSDTIEHTEVLLTKQVLNDDFAVVLDADALKEKAQGHIYFEVDFGDVIITSETYNMYYEAGDV